MPDLTGLRREIDRSMQEGEAFEAVEDRIGAYPLNDEEKAALWLYAWSLRPRGVQRLDALLMMGLLTPHSG